MRGHETPRLASPGSPSATSPTPSKALQPAPTPTPQGQPHGHVPHAVFQKGPPLVVQCSVVTILKFLILEAGPTFSFCTTHCKLYSHPGRQEDARDLTLRTQMPSSRAGQGEVTEEPSHHTHHHPHTRPTSEINKHRAMAVPHVYTGSMPGRYPPRSSPLTPQQPWK